MTRIAVISDIHSNLQALEAVWKRIREIGVDEVYCLGDVVGYGARPAECLALIRSGGVHCVQGNHDALVGQKDLHLQFNVYSLAAVEHNRKQLGDDDLDWLAGLPTFIQPDPEVIYVHGSPDDRDRYLIYEDDLKQVSLDLLDDTGPGVCFFGHTHHPVFFDGQVFVTVTGPMLELEPGVRMVVNPGSVGQPRDRDPRSSFCWWDRDQGTIHFERVEYDAAAARKDILDAGLPEILGDRLLQGR